VSIVWIAIALGVIEGITEYVPVSSTGHLILAGRWLAFPEDKAASFEIFIQLGAVIAVVWFYRERLLGIAARLPTDPGARAFVGKIFVAFLPAAVVGLLTHKWITRVLFGPLPVAVALAGGGAFLIAIDRPGRDRGGAGSLEDVTWAQALLIGVIQVAALWPGMSRSGATIIGGLLAGLSRRVALEFSFFLAIPTLGAASVFALWEARHVLATSDVPIFGLGFAVSFIVALGVVAWLLRYVSSHDLRPFGWYRIALGAIVIASVLI